MTLKKRVDKLEMRNKPVEPMLIIMHFTGRSPEGNLIANPAFAIIAGHPGIGGLSREEGEGAEDYVARVKAIHADVCAGKLPPQV